MNLSDWIGRIEALTDTATPTPYAALSAVARRPDGTPPAGTPLPPLWHWLYFLPLHRQSEIGPTGTRSGAASCHRCRCPAGCGRAASSTSTRRFGSATA